MAQIRWTALLVFLATIVVSTKAFLLPGAPVVDESQHQAANLKQNPLADLGEPYTSFSYAGTTVNIYRIAFRKTNHDNFRSYGSQNLGFGGFYRRQALYQFEPVAILDRSTVDSWYSGVNGQHVFGFQLQLWNETLRHAAATHLSQFTGQTVRSHQVQSIPFDKVILKTIGGHDERYQTAHSWIPYTQTVAFTVPCFDRAECHEVAQELKTNPGQFAHFRLAYSTDGSRRTETKTIDVKSTSVITQSSKLLSKIMNRYPRSAEVLLTAADAQNLLWNAVSDIVHNNFQHQPEAVVTREAHKIIYDQLEKAVVAGKLSLAADDTKWSTVFWEDPLSRPDAIARSLNERRRHLHRTEEFDDDHQQQTDSSDWKDETKETINELYEQHKEHVIFNGEKYAPKATQVFRIKLNVIRERNVPQELTNLQVPYHPTADLTAPIVHDGPYYSMGLIVPPELQQGPDEIPSAVMEPLLDKSVISRLIDGQTLIVRLRNARTGEYLYPGSDNLSHDAKRRRVFTWRNKDEVLGPWAEWRLTGMWRAGTFRVRFTSVRFPGEYLYPATDDFSYDKDRRRVFTWRQISNPEDVHLWADGAADWLLDTYRVNTELHPHRYALFNLKRREYLYVARDQLALDETRRRVFTWRGPENDVWAEMKNQWDIEVVRIA